MNCPNRRSFLKTASLVLFAFFADTFLSKFTLSWAGSGKGASVPLPAGKQEVPATDAVANALGYQKDISKIDFVKYPQRKKPDAKNQFCKNCSLYTVSNAGWGQCQMITSGLVAAEGWCGSWSKKS